MVINKEVYRWVDDQLEATGIKVDGMILVNLDEELAIKPSEIHLNGCNQTIGEYFGLTEPDRLSELNNFNESILTNILHTICKFYKEIYITNTTSSSAINSILDLVFNDNLYERASDVVKPSLLLYATAILRAICYKLDNVLVNFTLMENPLANTYNICWIEDIDLNVNLNRAYILISYIGKSTEDHRSYEFVKLLTNNKE